MCNIDDIKTIVASLISGGQQAAPAHVRADKILVRGYPN
jgi:hypothetical protein